MGGRGSGGHAHAGGGEAGAPKAVAETTTGKASGSATDAKTNAVNARWEKFVTSALTNLGGTPGHKGDWVKMTDLRATLDARGLSRAAQDEQLKRMSKEGKLHLSPRSARHLLTPADHAAAVRLGGEEQHWVLLA